MMREEKPSLEKPIMPDLVRGPVVCNLYHGEWSTGSGGDPEAENRHHMSFVMGTLVTEPVRQSIDRDTES